VVAAEVGVVDFQSPVERPNTPDFPLLKINFQENDPTKILQGLGLEQIWDRCKGLICSGENYCKCWRLGKVEQIEQMLYYLNLKSKKIYKISNIRELSKDVFYLFYTLKSLDISGVFTEQMCERMCAT
jgi:hypothetical protein